MQQSELLQRLNEETLRQGQARDGSAAGGGGRKVMCPCSPSCRLID